MNPAYMLIFILVSEKPESDLDFEVDQLLI